MEIILAVVVVAAVIFFGALISAGNERQRKAIDDLREQTVLWAMQDLRIKRERLARDVCVGRSNRTPKPLHAAQWEGRKALVLELYSKCSARSVLL